MMQTSNVLVGLSMAVVLLVCAPMTTATKGPTESPPKSPRSPSSEVKLGLVKENEQAEFYETTIIKGHKLIAKVPHDNPEARKQVFGSEQQTLHQLKERVGDLDHHLVLLPPAFPTMQKLSISGKQRTALFFPYFNGGSLARLLKASQSLNESTILAIAKGIALALRALHDALFVHNNVAPPHIYLERDADHQITAYLGDFDQAKEVTKDTIEASSGEDVFSFGTVLLQLILGRLLETDELSGIRKEDELLFDKFDEVPRPFRLLLGRCLSSNAENRPTPDEIIERLDVITKQSKMMAVKEYLDAHDPTSSPSKRRRRLFGIMALACCSTGAT
jgi:serine/threonine protein kinase